MDQLTTRVCNLPRDFHRVHTKSVVQLLREYGFLDRTVQLSRTAIIEVLNSDPSLIQDWLNYSADKRTSSGWFFLKPGRVGYLQAKLDTSRATQFDLQPIFANLTDACAEFIIRETEDIRGRHPLKRSDGDQSNCATNS